MTEKQRREKEEKKMDDLKDPKEQKSSEIGRLIDKTMKSKNKIWLGSDWHLYVRKEKNKHECHHRKDFDEIIKNVNEVMGKDDLFIYLGDICDGEMQDDKDKDEMKTILSTIPGNKILVLGNNDLFTTQYYKSCGFNYVTQSFEWDDILFTHVPCKNENKLNIHGHIHGYRTYWIPYTNQVDVAALGGRTKPVELKAVISAQPSYAKTIKECPDKFEEGYMYYGSPSDMNIFEQAFNNDVKRTYDPYPI